jgi:hypothetical protein
MHITCLSEKLIYKNIKLNTEKHATHRNKLTRGKLCEIYYLYIQCIHEKCQAIWTNIIERKSIIRLIMRLTVKNFCLGDYFFAIFIEFLILYLFSCGAYFSSENENRSHFRIELNPQYVS